MSRLLDPSFRWVPSASTDVTAVWKKHGWKPVSKSERRARMIRLYGDVKGRIEPEADELPRIAK